MSRPTNAEGPLHKRPSAVAIPRKRRSAVDRPRKRLLAVTIGWEVR
ncbi:MAG TPA: hypothetical protein VIJ50_01120 [Solirubrobacteraceae bacterium]